MILNYLSACFESGLAFNTVKAHNSAIILRHSTCGGQRNGKISFSAHPDIRAFLEPPFGAQGAEVFTS